MCLIQGEVLQSLLNVLVLCSAFYNKHIPENGYIFPISPQSGLRSYINLCRTQQDPAEPWLTHSPHVTWIKKQIFWQIPLKFVSYETFFATLIRNLLREAKNKIHNIPILMEVAVYIWLVYYKKIISMWSNMTM